MLVLVLQLYLAKQQTSKSFASSMVLDLYSHSVVLQKVLRSSKQQSVSTELLVSVQRASSPILQKILHNTPSVEMQSKNNWIITLDRESWTSSKVVLQLSLQKRRLPSVQMDLVSSHSLEQAPVRSIVLTLEVEIFPPSLVKRSTKKLRLQTTRLYRFNSLANLFPSLLEALLVLDLYSLHRVQQNLQLRIHQKIQFCLLFLVQPKLREQETSLVLDLLLSLDLQKKEQYNLMLVLVPYSQLVEQQKQLHLQTQIHSLQDSLEEQTNPSSALDIKQQVPQLYLEHQKRSTPKDMLEILHSIPSLVVRQKSDLFHTSMDLVRYSLRVERQNPRPPTNQKVQFSSHSVEKAKKDSSTVVMLEAVLSLSAVMLLQSTASLRSDSRSSLSFKDPQFL